MIDPFVRLGDVILRRDAIFAVTLEAGEVHVFLDPAKRGALSADKADVSVAPETPAAAKELFVHVCTVLTSE